MIRFIDRPILAIVISLLIVFIGVLSLMQLPMAQFPNIAPPEVNVTIEYTGANAETVVKSALVQLERAINGVPAMKYMSSDAGNDGVGVVQIIFEVGTNPDVAAVNVQNRVGTVMGELPPEVTRNGVKIAKEENAMLMYINLYSSDTTLTEKFLYNFADINLLPEIKRINGVGYAELLGAKRYAMRIWLQPDKMLAFGVSTEDVAQALENNNVEAAPGKIGENSDLRAQPLQYVLRYAGKFTNEAQYENIPIKATEDGKILRIRDVGRVEFGTTYFDVESKLNGKPSAALMIKQLPGSNAPEVISQIKERIQQIKGKVFLKGMDFEISYDVSRFLDAAISEVVKTLVEAFLLVSLVVFIFLQNWRVTLIPIIAVPVSLIGTFLFMQWFGFSLNLITLFALVLSIGIVVDNAIVVVEAVYAKIEKGMLPYHATEASMKEISTAIVSITLVMSAVFLPVAFMKGPSGIFFKQFSLTMAVSIVLSGVVALTLTPALCVLLLRPNIHNHHKNLTTRFFDAFNAWYAKRETQYQHLLRLVLSRKLITYTILSGVLIFSGLFARVLPLGFIPNEDQGTFYISVTTPSGSTLERTKVAVDAIGKLTLSNAAVQSVSTLAGTNVLSDGTGATFGTCLVNLKNWSDRTVSVQEVIDDVQKRVSTVKDARIELFPPPAVPGYGNASGFELRLLDKTGTGNYKQLERVTHQFISDLKSRLEIKSAFTIYDASFPQYTLNFDLDKAAQKGVTVAQAMETLKTYIGSQYASNFIRFGQMYKVMVQALPEYRALPDDVLKLSVKNTAGELVPISAFVSLEKTYGLEQITRYNLYPSAELNGEPAEGFSSGTVLKTIQEVANKKLPSGYDIDWAGISRDEITSGNQSLIIFIICLVFVYLILAGQYESFLLPLPVILSLPAGVLGAFLSLYLMGLENNIYAQIAMIMLIGLLGKNAILIVEFAMAKINDGKSLAEAVVLAATERLRPILMTSFAFVVGLIPLMFASGAGAVGNRTIGSAGAGGMLLGTVLGVILVPGLFVLIAKPKKK